MDLSALLEVSNTETLPKNVFFSPETKCCLTLLEVSNIQTLPGRPFKKRRHPFRRLPTASQDIRLRAALAPAGTVSEASAEKSSGVVKGLKPWFPVPFEVFVAFTSIGLRICLFSLVGFKRNLSLLEIF